MKKILKESNGRLSYREKAIWTRSYSRIQVIIQVYLSFLGRKHCSGQELAAAECLLANTWVLGLGLLLENTASLKIDSQ